MATKQQVSKRNGGRARPMAQARAAAPSPRQQAQNAARRRQQRGGGGGGGNRANPGPPGLILGRAGPGNVNLTGKGDTRNVSNNREQAVFDEDEYIADVTSSAAGGGATFQNVAFPVNPGQAGTFPWLAQVAARFEKYEFEYLEFYYKRLVSEYSAGGQTGKVILSFDADASDPAPTTKQQMEDTVPHVDCLPSENMALRVPQSMLRRLIDGFYVRPGAVPGSSDIKTYDVGTLNIATSAINGGTLPLGELHVRYRVRLRIPIIESGAAPALRSASQFASVSAGEVDANGSGQNYQILMPTAVANGLVAVNTAGSVVPPAGNYHMFARTECEYGSTANTAFAMGILKNGALLNPATEAGAANLTYATAVNATVVCDADAIVTANGTDAFTITVIPTYSGGGNPTVWGTLILQSI